jgi:hypothetical protein
MKINQLDASYSCTVENKDELKAIFNHCVDNDIVTTDFDCWFNGYKVLSVMFYNERVTACFGENEEKNHVPFDQFFKRLNGEWKEEMEHGFWLVKGEFGLGVCSYYGQEKHIAVLFESGATHELFICDVEFIYKIEMPEGV